MKISRFTSYSMASICVTALLIINAMVNNPYTYNAASQSFSLSDYQFFPTVTHLVSSKISMVVMANNAILFLVIFGKIISRIFFGTLRTNETETVWNRSYVSVIETCLALTIFREELTSIIFGIFVLEMFNKVFHWLVSLRVEFEEQTPHTSMPKFIRLFSCLFGFLLTDFIWIYLFSQQLRTNGPSVLLLFITEYLILTVTCIASIIRLSFRAVDMTLDSGVENFNVWTFYLDIAKDLLHCLIYMLFFGVIFYFYGMPIHLLRDLYIAVRDFKQRVMDLIRYRKFAAELDTSFPDATAEELEENDNTCNICFDEMESAKKLACGHMFHAQCLRRWLARSDRCPSCRRVVEAPAPDQQHQQQPQQQQAPPQQPQQPQPGVGVGFGPFPPQFNQRPDIIPPQQPQAPPQQPPPQQQQPPQPPSSFSSSGDQVGSAESDATAPPRSIPQPSSNSPMATMFPSPPMMPPPPPFTASEGGDYGKALEAYQEYLDSINQATTKYLRVLREIPDNNNADQGTYN